MTTETQLQMPGLWNDYDEDKAQFPWRITIEDLLKCSGKRVALDTETTGLEWWNKHMIGLGVWCPDAEVYGYIPALKESTREKVQQAVQQLAPETTIIMHNAKFDFHFLATAPDPFQIIDTTILVHLYDSRLYKKLTKAEEHFLGTDSKRKHLFKAPKKKKIWDWPIPTVADYCVNDNRVTYQLAEHLIPILVGLDLWKLFQKEMEYLKVIWHMERRGVLIDPEFAERALARFAKDQKEAEKELFEAIGYEFNWKSPTKLSKALYEDYGWDRPENPFADADGVDRTRFAGSGKYNKTLTDSFILMEKAKHPLGALVLHLRETKKLTDYLSNPGKGSGYLELADDQNVVHAGFNLSGTRTGRLACRKPNLHNVPSQIRTRETQSVYSGDTTHRIEEYNLRLVFVARPGYSFVGIDYKQMEMRMFGILAKDEGMLEALRTGEDIHANVSEQIWDTRDEVHREWAKTIGFGLIYGMTIGSVQFRLNMERPQAIEVTDDYWATFPRIKPWLQEKIDECKQFGFVRYWSGRIWREETPLDMFKGANAVIQGGCADLLSIAHLRCGKYLLENGLGHPIISIHDEVVFEILTEHLETVVPELRKIMEVPDLFNIPFFTDAKIGPNFGSMIKWDEWTKLNGKN